VPKTPKEPSGEQEGGEKPDGQDDDWSETEEDKLYNRSELLDAALGSDDSAGSGDMSDDDLMWGGAYGYDSDDDYY
jgi:hypothetical protein